PNPRGGRSPDLSGVGAPCGPRVTRLATPRSLDATHRGAPRPLDRIGSRRYRTPAIRTRTPERRTLALAKPRTAAHTSHSIRPRSSHLVREPVPSHQDLCASETRRGLSLKLRLETPGRTGESLPTPHLRHRARRG